MRIAAVDLISNTCFPLLAADALGLFKAEGLHVEIPLLAMLRGTQALHEGTVDLMAAGSIYDMLTQFPEWKGCKIIVALSQGTPWLLVVRADLGAKRGDINADSQRRPRLPRASPGVCAALARVAPRAARPPP